MRTVQLGQWELVRPLGRGAMGEVWLARGPDGEEVALKRLLVADSQHVLRFQREADALIQLRHPAIAGWRDAGLDPSGRPWVATELLTGGTLEAQVKRRGPLPPREAVTLALDMCHGLAAVHAAGFLHRDLKPANVLLGSDGRPKLVDFGLARPTARGGSLTETGTIMGSPGYMAPEQVRGDKADLGPEIDVYGLGATLFFLCTGQAPFRAPTVVACLEQIVSQPPRPPSELNPAVSPALDAILLRCLAKTPQERYPHAMALHTALADWLARDQRGAGGGGRRRLGLLVATCLLALGLLLARGERQAAPDVAPEPQARPGTRSTSEEPQPGRLLEVAHAAWLAHDAAGALAPLEVVVASAADPDTRAEAYLLQAQVLQYTGHSTAAVARALQLAADAARDPGLIALGAGMAACWSGEFVQARRALDDALARRPRDVHALYLRAQVNVRQKRWAEALADYTRALEIEPGFAQALHDRGRARLDQDDPAGALSDLNRALELDPGYELAYRTRGLARHGVGDQAGAIEDLSRWLERAPLDETCLFHRASARAALDDLAGAIDDYDRVLKIDPRDGVALSNRGVARAAREDYGLALPDLTRAIELGAGTAETHASRAKALLRLGSTDEALADFDRAIALDPRHARALLERAKLRQHRGDLQGAIADYSRLAELEPQNVAFLRQLGALRILDRDHAGALEVLRRALTLDPTAIDAWINRGLAHAALHDREAALQALDRALELDPQKVKPRALRAQLRKELGDLDGALADLETLLRHHPDDEAARRMARELRQELGR